MLYSLATMFRRRCWLGALCLVLAAMLPTYVLGSQVPSSPSSLPVFETLSIPASPLLYPSSPPILPSIPTQITDRVQRLTLWVDNTKKVVSRSFNKPRFIYSRLALRAYRAISASRSGPSPSPSATRTLGESLPPTRTRTTTTHHPAFPKPAHARLRGRSCASHRPSESSEPSPKPSSSRPRRRYTIAIVPCLARCLRVLYSFFAQFRRAGTGATHLSASLIQASRSFDTTARGISVFNLFGIILLFKLKGRRVHYRYDLLMEGYKFSSKRIFNQKQPWIAECAYFDRHLIEWQMWDCMDREIQSVRMKYARVPGFSLKVRVTRERKVRDWYLTIFGMRSVEVPQDDYNRADAFETEDEFMLVISDLDHDLELPGRRWNELARDWFRRDPPSPPPSPPQTPSPPQGTFLRPVRIVDPEEPEDEGGGEDML